MAPTPSDWNHILKFIIIAKALYSVRAFMDRTWTVAGLNDNILQQNNLQPPGCFNIQSAEFGSFSSRLGGGIFLPMDGLSLWQTILMGFNTVLNVLFYFGVFFSSYKDMPFRADVEKRFLPYLILSHLVADALLWIVLGTYASQGLTCTTITVNINATLLTNNSNNLLVPNVSCMYGSGFWSACIATGFSVLMYIVMWIQVMPPKLSKEDLKRVTEDREDLIQQEMESWRSWRRLILSAWLFIFIAVVGTLIYWPLSYINVNNPPPTWLGKQYPVPSVFNMDLPYPWGVSDSYYFVLTTILVIGYGWIVPETLAAQIVLIFYAFIGIAITANFLLACADWLTTRLKSEFVKSKWKTGKENGNLWWLIAGCFFTMVIYWLIGTFILQASQGWAFFDSLYVMYVSGTLLGFSQLLPVTTWGWEFLGLWLNLLAPMFALVLTLMETSISRIALGDEKRQEETKKVRRQHVEKYLDSISAGNVTGSLEDS